MNTVFLFMSPCLKALLFFPFTLFGVWGGGWVGSSRTHTSGGLDPAHAIELNAVGLKVLLLSSSF